MKRDHQVVFHRNKATIIYIAVIATITLVLQIVQALGVLR